MCDGIMDVHNAGLSAKALAHLEQFHKQGIIEILTEKSPLLPEQEYRCYSNKAVFSAKWSVTGRCNYRCRHCFQKTAAKNVELSTEQCREMIDQMAQCGIANIALTGGEPLVREDLFALISCLHEKDIAISQIYTNGSLLTEELLKLLSSLEMPTVFCISFDGIEFHDWLRNRQGAEKEAVRAIKLCKSFRFPVAVELCLCRENQDMLRDNILHLSKLGVDSVTVSPILRTGEWSKQNTIKDLSVDEIIDIYLSYIPRYFEDGMPVNLSLNGIFTGKKGTGEYSIPSVKFPENIDEKAVCICEHAKRQIYITAEGNVMPCMPLADAPGINGCLNLTEMKLSDILEHPTYLHYINMSLADYFDNNPECAGCEYRFACGAGCRADALFAGDDYFGPDRTRCKLLKENVFERIGNCAEKARKQYVL